MTRVVLAGMSPQVASAVELLVRSVFGGVAIVRHDRSATLTPAALQPHLRPADLMVLDLMGLGWVQCTPARAQSLNRDLLSAHDAVLMLPPEPDASAQPGGQGGWDAAVRGNGHHHGLHLCVQHPASMSTMRHALLQLHMGLQARAAAAATPVIPPAPAPAPAPATTATTAAPPPPARAAAIVPAIEDWSWPDSRPAFADTQPGAAPLRAAHAATASPPAAAAALAAVLAAASPASAPAAAPATTWPAPRPAAPPAAAPAHPALQRSVQPFALTHEAHAAIRAACPAIAANPFLALVFHVVLQGRPQAFHVGKQTGAVFHPAQNWVASNISTALRKRLTQHRLMLEIAEVQPLAEHQVLAHAQPLYGRRDDGRRALDNFIWALVLNSFEDAPPPVDEGLTFQLRRMPNFTRLPAVPDSFIQMALLCLRGPQTVATLRHAYPGVHPDRVGLFVLCVLLSGLAQVRPARSTFPAADAAPTAAGAHARPAATPKRSFIRSLLAKLF